MKKKRKASILSLVIALMMLFPQMPTRAVTNIEVKPNDSSVIQEDKVDEVIETKPDNSNSNNVTSEDNQTEEKNKNTQNSSIEIKDELIDENVNQIDENVNQIDSSKSSENKEIVGEVYEKKENTAKDSSFEAQVYEREEFNLKQESFSDVEELETKTDSNYEIALAHSDGTYTYVDSAENIEEAIEKVEEVPEKVQTFSKSSKSNFAISLNTTNATNEAIPVVLNSEGRVVSSSKSMGRILKHINGQVYGYFDRNTNVYSTAAMTSAFTYINQGYVDDVPIIEDNGKSAKVLVNGYQGWINRDVNSSEYDMIIVPINQVTNPSYYFSENGILRHFISSDLRSNTKLGTTIDIGVAPSYLSAGVRYLSYDGIYFYDGSNIANGLDKLISDLQNNNYANAVNSSNPYYNYYNYLPFRSTTRHTAEDLNRFIYANTKDEDGSKLRDNTSAFIEAQNKYGVNALLALGVAINESNWGKSTIAKQKNNIFGINAVDSNPGQAADSYPTVADSVYEFSKNQISRAYADPANWAYYGGYLGNKKLGANVKYASDPFWGEKASQHAFKADYFISGYNINNLKDYNNFQLGIFTSPTQVKNSSGQLLYNIIDNFTQYAGYVGTSVVVSSNNGSNYEINPERNTSVNDGGSNNKYHGNYSFSDKGYVNSSSIMLINIKKNGSTKTGWVKEGNNWYYFNSNGEPSIGLVNIDGHKYFFNNDGTMATGWKNINGNWYYFWGGGSMATGWVKVGNDWYYFWDGGSMATGWVKSGGYWYYLKGDGVMATGWQTIGNSKYYFWGGGSMATGTINIDGKSYSFRSDGSLI